MSLTIGEYQDQQAELWDTIAFCCTTIGQAIRDRDGIAGSLASAGLLENIALLSPELKTMLVQVLEDAPH